jgi:hypothetical protein
MEQQLGTVLGQKVVHHRVIHEALLRIQRIASFQGLILHVKGKGAFRLTSLPVVTAENLFVGISSNMGSPVIIHVNISAAKYVDVIFLQRPVWQHAGEFMPVLICDGLVMHLLLKLIALRPELACAHLPVMVVLVEMVSLPAALVRCNKGLKLLPVHSKQLLRGAMRMGHHQLDTAEVMKLG